MVPADSAPMRMSGGPPIWQRIAAVEVESTGLKDAESGDPEPVTQAFAADDSVGMDPQIASEANSNPSSECDTSEATARDIGNAFLPPVEATTAAVEEAATTGSNSAMTLRIERALHIQGPVGGDGCRNDKLALVATVSDDSAAWQRSTHRAGPQLGSETDKVNVHWHYESQLPGCLGGSLHLQASSWPDV